jgi:hypothetical protein
MIVTVDAVNGIENLGCAIIMQFLEVFNKYKIGDEKMLDKKERLG